MKKFLTFWLIFAFASQAVFGLMGTRPMGMGGAFTAVCDDANAPYWNPAGLALNPEVSLTGSTMLNNRNTWVGDNVGNLKLCYEAEMSPFEWIAGIGVASILALQGAKYLSEQGILKKGWGRPGETTSREASMAEQVKGSEEVVSLKQEVKEAAKEAARGVLKESKGLAKEVVKEVAREAMAVRQYYLMPWSTPWYHPNYYRPRYWEPPMYGPSTKAQFALGLSWLNDYNPPLDQNTNWYTFSLASGFEQRVALGAGVNLYNLQKISTAIKGVGADLDLGAIAKPVEYISIGVVAKGVLTTDIKWQDNSTTRYEALLNAGIAVKPIHFLTLAADAHNLLRQNTTYHYGAEAVILPGFLVRGGLSDGSKTAGLSLAIGNLVVDYAILGGVYNRTQMVGATWRF